MRNVACILFMVAVTLNTFGENESHLSWNRTDTSLALLNQGKVVWQHVHDRNVGKPYLRFGLLDGTELTRPVPTPKGYARADHPWHLALWWSWKYINGVNFWEKNHAGTDPVNVDLKTRDDGSATITLTIHYHLEGQPPWVKETRMIDVSAPDKKGAYHIDWKTVFNPAGAGKVVFNKNSYGGFAWRGAAEFSRDKKPKEGAWVFMDHEGRRDGSNGKQARWVAFTGKAQNGKPAAIAIFDHPENPRHPTWWQTRNNYPYLNPSFTCKEDFTLNPGENLTLKYRVVVSPGVFQADQMEKAWKAFSAR